MTIILTPEALAARKRRNVWIALGLVAFMALVFTTTFLRMQQNQRDAREARFSASAPAHPSTATAAAPVATPAAPAGGAA